MNSHDLRKAITSPDPLTRDLARRLAHSRLCWHALASHVEAAIFARNNRGGQQAPVHSGVVNAPLSVLLSLRTDAACAIDGPTSTMSLNQVLDALERYEDLARDTATHTTKE